MGRLERKKMSDDMRPITRKELDDLKEQLTRMRTDKDRLRLINVTAEQFQFTTEEIVEVVEHQHYGDAQRMTAINLFANCTDPENFQMVIDCFKFAEDRDEIIEATGFA